VVSGCPKLCKPHVHAYHGLSPRSAEIPKAQLRSKHALTGRLGSTVIALIQCAFKTTDGFTVSQSSSIVGWLKNDSKAEMSDLLRSMSDAAHHFLHSHAAARSKLPLQNGRGDSCAGDAGEVVGAWCRGHQATGQQSSSVHLSFAMAHAVTRARLQHLSMLWLGIKVITTSCAYLKPEYAQRGRCLSSVSLHCPHWKQRHTRATSIAPLHLVQPAIHLAL